MNLFTAFLVPLAFTISSMQPASDSNHDILGTWVFDRVEVVYAETPDPEEQDFIDALFIPMLEEGLSYIHFNFYADGTMRTIVDSPEENSDELGHWNLSADGKLLTLQSDEGVEVQNVHLLNNSEMILAIEDEGFTMLLHLKKK